MEKLKWKKGVPNNHVHIMGTVMGGEFTLCGDSFDIDEDLEGIGDGEGGLVKTKEKINCPECISVIELCKAVQESEIEKQINIHRE